MAPKRPYLQRDRPSREDCGQAGIEDRPRRQPHEVLREENARRLGYRTNYVVDGGKARIILSVLVTPGEASENRPMLDLLWRPAFRWKLRPHHVTVE